jgi:hypothetical protein
MQGRIQGRRPCYPRSLLFTPYAVVCVLHAVFLKLGPEGVLQRDEKTLLGTL